MRFFYETFALDDPLWRFHSPKRRKKLVKYMKVIRRKRKALYSLKQFEKIFLKKIYKGKGKKKKFKIIFFTKSSKRVSKLIKKK